MMNEKNITCYLSEVGHKNFHYPTNTKAILKSDCEYSSLNWICTGSRNLKAIKVKNNCVLPLTFTNKNDKDIISTNNDFYVVVWIDK